MQRPRNPDDDEDDTAFGGLAPRSGPGPKARPERRGSAGKWLVAIVVVMIILLIFLYITGRL
jgi:hypothetical protein